MPRTPKGKHLTSRPIRLDDDVWAELQKMKAHGTINEGLRGVLFNSYAQRPRGIPNEEAPEPRYSESARTLKPHTPTPPDPVKELPADDAVARALERLQRGGRIKIRRTNEPD